MLVIGQVGGLIALYAMQFKVSQLGLVHNAVYTCALVNVIHTDIWFALEVSDPLFYVPHRRKD